MVEVGAEGEDALVGGRVRADRRTVTVSEEERKIRWWTYVVAAIWAAVLVGIALAMRPLRFTHNELGVRPPFTTRIVVGMPIWIVSGLLLAGALIWKSKLLSPRTSDLIDTIAAASGLFLALFAVVVAMFLPFSSILFESIEP